MWDLRSALTIYQIIQVQTHSVIGQTWCQTLLNTLYLKYWHFPSSVRPDASPSLLPYILKTDNFCYQSDLMPAFPTLIRDFFLQSFSSVLYFFCQAWRLSAYFLYLWPADTWCHLSSSIAAPSGSSGLRPISLGVGRTIFVIAHSCYMFHQQTWWGTHKNIKFAGKLVYCIHIV